MLRLFWSLPALSLIICSCNPNDQLPILQASSKSVTLVVDGEKHENAWGIAPEIRFDELPVEVMPGSSSKVRFITDQDSIEIELQQGQEFDFVVLLNSDSAFTRIKAVPPKAYFTEEYIRESTGKWSVEVIEAQELLQVVMVITPTGLADTKSMIINHDTTPYYLDVLNHFLEFKSYPVVTGIDSMLQKNWYINLKADACALVFDTQGNLKKSLTYDRMRGGENLLTDFMEQLSDFSKESGFRQFYKEHQWYYDSLIHWHERIMPTQTQWDWLENQFPDHSYDNYRITFSPLVKGNHSTVRFNQDGFKQAVMFIAPPKRYDAYNENISNGLVTRIVFTEIDHNYVNPESDKYLKDINMALKNREEWTEGGESGGYNTAYAIFNEYMTWSVYLLYCSDQYPQEDFEVINDRIVNYIINRRGFSRFREFNQFLLDQYQNRGDGVTVADLYPSLLDWAMSQS